MEKLLDKSALTHKRTSTTDSEVRIILFLSTINRRLLAVPFLIVFVA